MLDFINSLDREGLIKLGKKHKLIGHLSNFTSPYLSDDQIRLSVIKEMEKDEEIPSNSNSKNKSLKRKNAKRNKRLSKKQRDYGCSTSIPVKPLESHLKFPQNYEFNG